MVTKKLIDSILVKLIFNFKTEKIFLLEEQIRDYSLLNIKKVEEEEEEILKSDETTTISLKNEIEILKLKLIDYENEENSTKSNFLFLKHLQQTVF